MAPLTSPVFFAPVSLEKTASWHRERGDRKRRSPFFLLLLDGETFSVRFGDDLCSIPVLA